MSASAVIAGLKTVIEANGYTVHNDRPVEDLRDKGAVIEQESVVPVHEENATRHEGTFVISLNDKIAPKRRYSNERTRAGRIETLMKAIDAAYTGWSLTATVEDASTETTGEYRVTTMTITALYAV